MVCAEHEMVGPLERLHALRRLAEGYLPVAAKDSKTELPAQPAHLSLRMVF